MQPTATDSARAQREVASLDPLRLPGWDAEASELPGASFFHGSAWARALAGAYGFTPLYFARRTDGRLDSILPLMEVRSRLTGNRGVALPFTDECAPLCAGADGFGEIWAAVLAHGRKRGWRYVECRGGLPLFPEGVASMSYFGHKLDLRAGEARLLAGLDSSVRRSVKKAGQSGLSIEFSDSLAAVGDFYRLLRKTRKRHGLPPQPMAFFESIQRHILAPGKGVVVLARLGRQPVAGAVYFHFQKTVTYKFGASDEAFQHLRGNNLVMWEAIRHHARLGFETMDFGRTSMDNDGLRRFKLGWGAAERPVDYVRFNLRSGTFASSKDGTSGMHTRIFKLLPERLSGLIGALLYNHAA